MDNGQSNFKLEKSALIGCLIYLLTRHKGNSFRLIKHIFTDYFAKQFRRKPAVCVDVALDQEIQPVAEAIGVYFSFLPFLIGSLGFVKKEFKSAADRDIDDLIVSLIGLYHEAGLIFDCAPTTLAGRKSCGLAMRLLHLLDRPRNYFPSFHVVLVSYVFHKVCKITEKHAHNPEDHKAIKRQMFDKTVGIIESCLLTKQHGLRDIAGGLAFISSQESEFGDKLAPQLMDSIFSGESFGMTDNLAEKIRSEIRSLYFDITGCVEKIQITPYNYSQPFIDYIHSIKKA